MSHANIPIFVPHLACPNRCIFCDQKKISGTVEPILDPTPFLEQAVAGLQGRFDTAEIAFFGGSFTAIPRPRMEAYLRSAEKFLRSGQVTGIRLSTRPDAISEDIAACLMHYGVTAVELGVQSLDNSVLTTSKRGHTAEDVIRATEILRKYPFELVYQLMPGLPNDTEKSIHETFQKTVRFHPDAVRLYPCLVIRDTELAEWYRANRYHPLPLDKAIRLCADAVCLFRNHGIRILRIGLHGSDLTQSDSILAGPFHPAFGELVFQEIYRRAAIRLLKDNKEPHVTLTVQKGCLSKLIGPKRCTVLALEQQFHCHLHITEAELEKEIIVRKTNSEIKYDKLYTL